MCSDLLTGLFFMYRNLCTLMPALLRVFLGKTIKNPDNHLDISSFLCPCFSSHSFSCLKNVPFPLAVFQHSAFSFPIFLLVFIFLPRMSLWAFLPPFLPHCECRYPWDSKKISRCKQKHKSLCFSAPTFLSSISAPSLS